MARTPPAAAGTMGRMPAVGATGPPLVGRDRERDVLAAEVERAWSATTRCLMIGGEAGIGKTRLAGVLAALATQAEPSALVAWGQCVDLGGDGMPYVPFLPVLRSVAASLGEQGVEAALGPGRAELARLLPDLGPPSEDSSMGQGRLFDAVARLLERAAAQRPLVVVLEDLHWADASTRELLSFLVRTLDEERVLLAVTYRSDEMHRRHPLRPLLAELERHPRVSTLSVGRLETPEVEALLAALRGEPPDPAVVAAVAARSGGVPLFVEELATAQRGTPLPDTLRDLLLLRVQALSPTAQRILAAAAVGGARVAHTDLAAVLDEEPGGLDAALREAVDGHVLMVDRDLPGYAFRHALLREAVIDELLPGELITLHGRWAGVLGQRLDQAGPDAGLAVQVAHHWHAALDQPRAFAAAVAAADAARAARAPQEEIQMLERALALWARVPDPDTTAGMDRAALLERASLAAVDAADQDRAGSLLDAALAEVDPGTDPQRHAHLLVLRLARTELSASWFRATAQRALDLLPADVPSKDRARLLWRVAGWHLLRSELQAAGDLARQAVEMARLLQDRRAESQALRVLSGVTAGLGDLDTALQLMQEARRLAVEAGSARALANVRGWLGDLWLSMGRFSEGAEAGRAWREEARGHGLGRAQATHWAVNEAAALVALGHWDDALALADEFLDGDLPQYARLGLSQERAAVLVGRGDPRAADADLDRMTDWFPDQPQFSLPTATLRAELALASGQPHTALTTLLDALDGLPRPTYGYGRWPLLHTLAKSITAVEQDTGTAHTQARAALTTARQTFTPHGNQHVWDTVIDAELTLTGDAGRRQPVGSGAPRPDPPGRRGPGPPARLHRLPARRRPAGPRPPRRRHRHARRRARAGPRTARSPTRNRHHHPRPPRPHPPPRRRQQHVRPRRTRHLADPPRARGPPPRGPGPLERPDRRRTVHQPQDSQRPRLQHPRQAGRHLPRRSRRQSTPRRTPRHPHHTRLSVSISTDRTHAAVPPTGPRHRAPTGPSAAVDPHSAPSARRNLTVASPVSPTDRALSRIPAPPQPTRRETPGLARATSARPGPSPGHCLLGDR